MLAALVLFARRVAAGWTGISLIVIALLCASPVISFEYRILFTVALLTYLSLTSDRSRKVSRTVLGLIAVLMAIATMIKLTAFMMGAGILVAIAAVLAKRKEYDRLILFVAVFALAWLLLWKSAGQGLGCIPDYLANSAQIALGYNAAMAIYGKVWHLYLAVITIAVIVILCAMSARKGDFHPLLLAILLGGSLLVSYKQGFVRQDKSHVVYFFGNTMLMLAVLYPLLAKTTMSVKKRGAMLVCFFALAVGIYDAHRVDVLAPHSGVKSEGAQVFMKKRQMTRRLGVTSLRSALSLVRYAPERVRFRQESIAQIRQSLPLCEKTLEAAAGKTIDVFPWDVALLYAYGLNWSPRPAFQSYSAYTKQLDRLNASHFGGTGSPDMIFFSFKPLDCRYPLFDEPETFRTILRNYRLHGADGEFLLLERKKSGPEEHNGSRSKEIGALKYARLGRPIAVPACNEGRVFARVFLEYNWIGRIVGLLYKPSQVYIKLEGKGADVSAPRYRFIPDQARNGILLSAHVRDLAGLADLFSSGGERRGRIEEIVIEADSTWQYAEPFAVQFFVER
jgi:hypothetical protein